MRIGQFKVRYRNVYGMVLYYVHFLDTKRANFIHVSDSIYSM